MTNVTRHLNRQSTPKFPEQTNARTAGTAGSPPPMGTGDSRQRAGNAALAGLPKKQRRAVKALAVEVDSTISEYKRQTNADLIFDVELISVQ